MKTNQLNKDNIINFLRANKKFLNKEFGVTKIALFGSYARGEEEIASDIDLLIETKEHDFDNRYNLKEFLEEQFNKTVDIGYFSCVRSFIMQQIQGDIIYA